MSTHNNTPAARDDRGEGLDAAYMDVADFQRAFGQPVADAPAALDRPTKRRRLAWMREELEELEAAETIEDQADAIIDLVYFAMGCLTEMGVPPEGVWQAVHKANMAKLWPDGVHVDAVGKVIKPAGWRNPEGDIRDYIASLHRSRM